MDKVENTADVLETVKVSISAFRKPETAWDRQIQGLGVVKIMTGLLDGIS
jgi:hypothetical protein